MQVKSLKKTTSTKKCEWKWELSENTLTVNGLTLMLRDTQFQDTKMFESQAAHPNRNQLNEVHGLERHAYYAQIVWKLVDYWFLSKDHWTFDTLLLLLLLKDYDDKYNTIVCNLNIFYVQWCCQFICMSRAASNSLIAIPVTYLEAIFMLLMVWGSLLVTQGTWRLCYCSL